MIAVGRRAGARAGEHGQGRPGGLRGQLKVAADLFDAVRERSYAGRIAGELESAGEPELQHDHAFHLRFARRARAREGAFDARVHEMPDAHRMPVGRQAQLPEGVVGVVRRVREG